MQAEIRITMSVASVSPRCYASPGEYVHGIDDVFQDEQTYWPADSPAARPSTGRPPDVGKAAAYPRHGEFDTGTRSDVSGGSRSAEEGASRTPPRGPSPPPWGFYALVAALALGAILAGALLGNSLNDVAGAQALARRRGPAADEDGSTVGGERGHDPGEPKEPTETVKGRADEEEEPEETTTRKPKKKKKPVTKRPAVATRRRRRKTTVKDDDDD
ncbi:hypothetical protein MTO96_028549 [Rhipicephalus appendiculatus]